MPKPQRTLSAPVTLDDVARAKAELEEAGKSVSVASVIAHLGRGSSSTVTPLLRQVRGGAAQSAASARPVPEAVIGRLEAAAKASAQEAYNLLMEPVEALLRAKDEELAVALREAQADVDQALAELAQVTVRSGVLEQQVADAATRLADATERIGGLESAARSAQEQLQHERAGHEQTRHLAAQQANQLQELVAAGQREREGWNAQMKLQEEAARAREQALQARLDAAITEAAEMRGRLAVDRGR